MGILGRRDELASIERLLDGAAAASGAVVLIEGEPGIGKTSLLRATRRLAAGRGFAVISGRAGELERPFAFGLVRQAIEPVLEALPGAERDALLGGVVRPAGGAIAPDAQGGAGTRPESHAVLNGLFWLLARLAARAPLLLALDDVHWADEGTLRLLPFLARRIESVPVLIAVTARRRLDPQADAVISGLAADPAVTTLRPRTLGEAEIATLLGDKLGTAPEPGFTSACLEASGGNPFLLTELCHELAEAGLHPTAVNAVAVASMSPESVSRSVAARVARLGAPAAAITAAVAVFGQGATPALAARLAGVDERVASDAIDRLARAGVLATTTPLDFAHPLLRTAVDAELAPGERSRLHALAARLQADAGASVERIALHLLEAEPRADAATARLLLGAGRGALRRGAPETAVRLLSRAVSEPPAEQDRAATMLELGAAEAELGLAVADGHLRLVAVDAPDLHLRGRALLDLAWLTGPRPEAQRELLPLYTEVIAAVGAEDRELELQLEAARLSLLFIDPLASDEFHREASRFRDLNGDTPAECALLAWAARRALMTGATSVEVADLAERGALGPDLAAVRSVWFLHLVFSLASAERMATAEKLATGGLEAAVERGSASSFATASMQRATVRHMAGDLRGSEADARAALGSGGLAGFYAFQPVAPLLHALADQGKVDEARALIAEHGLDGELPRARPYTALLIGRGRLRAAAGDLQAAVTDLCEAVDRIRVTGTTGVVGVVGLDAQLDAALALHGLGASADARRLSDQALAAATAWDGSRAIGGALRVAGLIRGGEEGLAMLEQAAAALCDSPARLWYAQSLVDLGAALRRANRRRDCRAPLRDGIELAKRCGATPLAERARYELRASGGRVPPRVGGSYNELTPSELRIAELAASGLSNPEIAQRLFVTIKTVEMHLSNSYRKLGIGSRRQLADALAPVQRAAAG